MRFSRLGRSVLAVLAVVVGAAGPVWATDVVIGDQTGLSGAPFLTAQQVARTQVIYLASEINGACTFDAISLNVSIRPSVKMTNLTIRLKHTPKADFSAATWEVAGWSTVYRATYNMVGTGWKTFLFTTPFEYNGVDNLMVDVSFDNTASGAGINGQCFASATSSARLMYASGSGLGDPLSWAPAAPAPVVSNQILNIKLQLAPVATPVFEPDAGTYEYVQYVTVTCTTPGNEIHYTTNGVDPTDQDDVIDSGAGIYVGNSQTLKARAWAPGFGPSAVKSAVYTITPVATPTFTPTGGTYGSPQNVRVECATPGAVICFTTDGVDPTVQDDTIPSGQTLLVDHTLTLKARAFRAESVPSAIKSADYAITVATPTFSVTAGTYSTAQTVTVACATEGADIHYTTDGADPTAGDAAIAAGGTIAVDLPMTLKARAFKTGWTPSAVKSADYSFTAATPTFAPDAGSYSSPQNVIIGCASPDAEIHYTTNGVDPVQTDAAVSPGVAVVVDRNQTLRAKAWRTGWTPSAIKTAAYSFAVATPTFAPDGGSYSNPQNVIVTCSSPGTEIHYTLNGADPSMGDEPVTPGTPILVDRSLTLRARAWRTGWTPSAIKTAVYSLTPGMPAFSPDAGTYPNPVNVVFSCPTEGGEIHYTTNGVDPTTSDPAIASGSSVLVEQALTLKARVFKTGWPAGAVKSAAYAFTAAMPSFSPDAGTYIGPQNVVVTCATSGAEIHYTTNGVDPTITDPVIASGASVLVGRSMTLKAKAWKTGYGTSMKSAAYTIGKIVYVKPTGNDGNDGRSWASAKQTIAAALNTAAASDQVWVAGDGDHPYVQRIALKAGVGLYGGFSGAETQIGQRNIAANVTIIDADHTGSAVTASSGTTTTRIDGFTIRNSATSGINCVSASPTIANNTITGNAADRGGGIYCSGSSAVITNNVITANTASSLGGGIYFLSAPGNTPVIANNVIAGNTSVQQGGGIHCSYPAVVRNNTIVGNTGSQGGGIYSASNPSLVNNIVAFNSSGISVSGGTVLRNNCVYNPASYNYSGVSAGATDISADPHLRDRLGGDYHLSPASPCVDHGDDSVVPAGSMDMDGGARIQGAHVDMGADESDPSASPRVIFVRPPGNDGNDGLSWGTAKASVNAALSIAGYDDQVWVAGEADGAYVERITLKEGLALYGGFAGTEAEVGGRDIAAHETILDGSAGGSVVTIPAGLSAAARIDGFTIRNGSAASGGGVYCAGPSSPIIANNTITQNNASSSGGGLYCSKSNPSVTGNRFTGNTAPSGGAIACVSYATPAISGNTITGNSASSNGGAIHCLSSNPTIRNNRISGNSAQAEAGGIYCDAAGPSILNNLIWDNQALMNAGGICCRNNAAPDIVNNTIAENTAGLEGGALYCDHSLPEVTNNIIAFNSSGVFQAWGPPLLTSNCVFNPGGYDYSGMIPGVGDVSADPQFDLAHGTFHLQPASPCVDGGYDPAVGTGWVDVDGGPRIQGKHVDIGVDEANPVVYVGLWGDDANPGTSWDGAKRTVQAGVDTAVEIGGEVWVGVGTYSENIVLDAYGYLYGGFAGGETERSQRDWRTNVTILDGGGVGSVAQASAIYGRIDGFTLQNGRAVRGGAILCLGGTQLTIANNTIRGNSASASGGAIDCEESSPTVANNVITGNSSPDGGAMNCHGGAPTITNNTLVANGSGAEHGGIRCDASSPVISNNIVAFNSSGIVLAGTGTPALRNNDVYGNANYNYSGLSAGIGDLSLDPLFVDAGGGDLHVVLLSPCLNSGWNGAPGLPPSDMDGADRILARAVDIGAYELVACLADFDRDADVDDDDLSWLVSCGSGPGVAVTIECASADFDLDRDVDSDDFAGFQRCRTMGGLTAPPDCLE